MTKTIEQYAEEFADTMVKGALGTGNDYYDSYIKVQSTSVRET